MRVIGCVADNCNTKDFVGIGALGDAFGQVYMAGTTNLTDTSGHMLVALNNTFLRCGQGRASGVFAFYVIGDPGLTSSRLVLDSNNLDAANPIWNPDSVTIKYSKYPADPTYTASRVLVSNAAGVPESSTVTSAKLAYVDATSSIQNQIDSKGTTFSGTASRVVQTNGSGALETSSATVAQLGYLDATSSVQTQLDSKAAPFNSTASRVCVTDGSGDLVVSSTTATQLGYLDATSSIQNQIDNAGGGGFSGTADRVMITNGSGDAAASNITATELGYLDNLNKNVKTELAKRPTVDDPFFNDGWLTVEKGSGDVSLWVKSGGRILSLTTKANQTSGGMFFGSAKHWMFTDDGGRHKFEGALLQIPMGTSTPTWNSANSKGGLWVDTTSSPYKLMFHDNTGWQQIS